MDKMENGFSLTVSPFHFLSKTGSTFPIPPPVIFVSSWESFSRGYVLFDK